MKTYINGHCIEQVLTNAVELTTAQYNALPAEQKSHGTYIITDAEAPSISAENVSYDMGGGVTTNVQTELGNKVSKSGDTMTGDLILNNASETTSNQDSTLTLGNTIPEGTVGNSAGTIHIYARSGKCVQLFPSGVHPSDIAVTFPYESGRLALDKYGYPGPTVAYSEANIASYDVKIDPDAIYLLTISVNGGGGSRFLTPDLYLIYVEDRNSHIIGATQISNRLGDAAPTITYQSDTVLYRITKANISRRSLVMKLAANLPSM